jgi:hypothetical protein
LKSLLAYANLASLRLDAITSETMAGFAAKRREQGLEVSGINRELQVLRPMFSLAQEWRKVEKVLPKVRMLPGESHRERVLTVAEETAHLKAAREWDMTANARALLPDVARVLLDCALRPEECSASVFVGRMSVAAASKSSTGRPTMHAGKYRLRSALRRYFKCAQLAHPAIGRFLPIPVADTSNRQASGVSIYGRARKERSSGSRSTRFGTRV